jgi:hypothetical protein
MPSGLVPRFTPSKHGFHFANTWPSVPARWWGVGYVHLGIGDVGRGLCGGMSHAVRDRFERDVAPPGDTTAPPSGTPLFRELVARQFDSFATLWSVPLRFWWMSAEPESMRVRTSLAKAWNAIKADIDAGRLPMIGLVRSTGLNPLRNGLGHQVAGFRYDEAADRITIGIYDPNHPDEDGVELRVKRIDGGGVTFEQSTGEALRGLLALPYVAPRSGR